ncbi:MAG TPA: DedA family protein [Longimicrobiales bacterium]|nr:DedA family protein [Longimicrobiales bacterium]
MIDSLIQSLAAQPPLLIYVIVGLGAALENVFPPVPSDTFALLGAFLAAQGAAVPAVVFAVVWVGNVSTALLTYGLGRRYGKDVFTRTRLGRWLLHPGQLAEVERFFGRWGTAAMFVSRFIPAVRAVAPVFAGVSRMGFWRMFPPLAVASAIWYAVLVWVGTTAGRNWRAIRDALEPYNAALAIVGGLLLIGIGWWWWRSRRAHRAKDAGRV